MKYGGGWHKYNKQIWVKQSSTERHRTLVQPWAGNKSAHGEWERVRHWLCLQSPGSRLVGPGSPSGHWFWGLRVLGLFEKDLWSRIKMIYLRTEDREVFQSLKAAERRDTESERWRARGLRMVGGARGRGEEELCVMSVFPCLSYFEMCLNSPPSVRPVPGLRAGRSPPREPEPTGTSGGQHAWIFE